MTILETEQTLDMQRYFGETGAKVAPIIEDTVNGPVVLGWDISGSVESSPKQPVNGRIVAESARIARNAKVAEMNQQFGPRVKITAEQIGRTEGVLYEIQDRS